MTDIEVLRPLVDRLLELAALPVQRERAQRFARLNALRPIDRAPVAVVHELIPGEHWVHMLGDQPLLCQADDARQLEFRLKRDLWAEEHIADDRPCFARVISYAAMRQTRGWGVTIAHESVGGETTAWRYQPPLAERIDVSRLTEPEYELDRAETDRRVARVQELTEGRLAVRVQYPTLEYHIFDLAVSMRGMDNILMDCAVEPEAVHELMEFLTSAYVRHHRQREREGWLNALPSPCGSYGTLDWAFYHCAEHPDPPSGTLADEWAYTSAQTSSGLGPEMFAEFVVPYNSRVVEPFTRGTVYYHGCERLDDKCEALAGLPNLRRIHVSPWSSVARAREVFGLRAVLEVHDLPTAVFLTRPPEEDAAAIRELLAQAGDCSLDLNLNDIHSINSQPERLIQWCRAAREVSCEFGARGPSVA